MQRIIYKKEDEAFYSRWWKMKIILHIELRVLMSHSSPTIKEFWENWDARMNPNKTLQCPSPPTESPIHGNYSGKGGNALIFPNLFSFHWLPCFFFFFIQSPISTQRKGGKGFFFLAWWPFCYLGNCCSTISENLRALIHHHPDSPGCCRSGSDLILYQMSSRYKNTAENNVPHWTYSPECLFPVRNPVP